MDRQLIEQKLESLRRVLSRVESRLPASVEALLVDIDAQDIVSLNLTRAVQLCVDIAAHVLASRAEALAPQTMGQTFGVLCQAGLLDEQLAKNLQKSVGFRNIMVHSYRQIDWAIVFSIGHNRLEDFKLFARAMVAVLDEDEPRS